MTHTITRYHDFSAGHRVAGHENKCANLHGHNYRVHFVCQSARKQHGEENYSECPELDRLGRVIDFAVIKERLCQWLEDNWDHKMLLWKEDNPGIATLPPTKPLAERSVILVPFNPTAENMAEYLVKVVGPQQLEGTGVELIEVTVDETRKCSATYKKEIDNG